MKNALLVTIAAFTLLPACGNGQESPAPVAVTPTTQNTAPIPSPTLAATDLKRLLSERPGQLVDVRTPEEWQEGVIEGALLMDLHGNDFAQQVATLDKDRPVYLYCAAGGRSYKAMQQLVKLGFTDVHDLEGGMGGWSDAGYATVPPSSTGNR